MNAQSDLAGRIIGEVSGVKGVQVVGMRRGKIDQLRPEQSLVVTPGDDLLLLRSAQEEGEVSDLQQDKKS